MPCVMLCGKIYHYRRQYSVKDNTITAMATNTLADKKETLKPPTPEEIQSATDYLAKQWIDHKKTMDNFTNTSMYGKFLNLREDSDINNSRATLAPGDSPLGNLALDFENDAKVCFLPVDYSMAQEPTEKEVQNLSEGLRAGFTTGKILTVLLFSTPGHTVAAAFQADGQFQVIDSMGSKTIDVDKLSEKLNQAKIKDAQGHEIQFSGKYINTKVQYGGHECIRFATLYAYQIAKERNLSAYKKVNGAIETGLLKRFEDCRKISEVTKEIEEVNSSSREKYHKFMSSWAYRTQNLTLDDWKKMSLEDLSSSYFANEQKSQNLLFIIAAKDETPCTLLINPNKKYFIGENETPAKQIDFEAIDFPPIPLTENLSEVNLGSLISSQNKTRLLLLNKDKHSICLYELPSNHQIVMPSRKDEKGNIIYKSIS